MKRKKIRKVKKLDKVRNYKSFTQIDMYLNCGQKYKYAYVDNIKVEKVNINFILGEFIHDSIASILIARMEGKDYTTDQRNELIEYNATKMEDKIKSLAVNEEDKKLYTQDYIDKIKLQHNKLLYTWSIDILPEIDPIAVEKKISVNIGGTEFIGYIDLIDKYRSNEERIIDWKVTKRAKSMKDVTNSMQLAIYSLATGINNTAFCSLIKPNDRTNIVSWSPNVTIVNHYKSESDLHWIEDVIKNALQGINSNYFPKSSTNNFLCNEMYCDYWNLCRGKNIIKPNISWINE